MERAQHLDLLVAHRGRIEVGRRLHRHQREQLQHVVLNHVAQRAGAVIIIGAAFEPDRFTDGDLDMVDVRAVPQRLEHQIGEAQGEEVLDRLLAEIMVDAENPVLRKARGDRIVDLAARGEIGPERFLECEADIVGRQADRREPGDHRLEQAGRGGEKDRQPRLVAADRLGEAVETALVVDVERDVIEPGEETRRDLLVEEAVGEMFLKRHAGEFAERLGIKGRASRADDIEVVAEQPVRIEPVERRQQHPASEVAGRAEHQESGGFVGHARGVTSGKRNGSEFRLPRRIG